RLTMASILSCVDQPILMRSGIGMPATVEYSTIGTIVSPWPPSTKAVTSSTLTLNSSARKWRKRALSSTAGMPTTRLWGRPENSRSAHTIASSGLVMQMTKLFGAWVRIPSPTAFITLRLMPRRSSRLMPGLRATPAVTMHTSAPAMSAKSGVAVIFAVDASAGYVSIVGCALHLRVEVVDRTGLRDVEPLALGHAFHDVEQDDVAQFA